jgi:hypothetical protein
VNAIGPTRRSFLQKLAGLGAAVALGAPEIVKEWNASILRLVRGPLTENLVEIFPDGTSRILETKWHSGTVELKEADDDLRHAFHKAVPFLPGLK